MGGGGGAVSEVWGRSPKLPKARGSGASAAKKFCIFYVKVNFSAFNCIICGNIILLQAWATHGPDPVRATILCGPLALTKI